jgi:hypothetical protein
VITDESTRAFLKTWLDRFGALVARSSVGPWAPVQPRARRVHGKATSLYLTGLHACATIPGSVS